jgi:ketosteroid isomerase-like protein
MSDDVMNTMAGLEDERYAAMLSCDTGKLDRLLDDRLRYVHSSGRVDNKTSYLNGFGRLWQHRSIDRQDQAIVPLGDTALVLNTLHISVQVGDNLREVSARALAVWHKSGGAWRLIAVFSAALPTTPQNRDR